MIVKPYLTHDRCISLAIVSIGLPATLDDKGFSIAWSAQLICETV